MRSNRLRDGSSTSGSDEEWGEWMRETLLLNVPHRQVVFTVPKMLRIFLKYKRPLLGELCVQPSGP